jgi:two-component system C4-dicarboxylate transport response regulator DctD
MSIEAAARPSPFAAETPRPTGGRVLLVDPDPAARSFYSSVVKRLAGVEVVAFPSAEALLDDSRVEPPACLITELELPGMNGLELYRRLRERHPAGGWAVVFVAGGGDVRSAVEAVRLGAVDYLEKPCPAQTLLRAVTGALCRTGVPRMTGRTR